MQFSAFLEIQINLRITDFALLHTLTYIWTFIYATKLLLVSFTILKMEKV